MHVIHATTDTGLALYHHLESFCRPLGLKSLTADEAVHFIRLSLDESLNQRMRWATNDEVSLPYLDSVLDWWDSRQLNSNSANVCQKVYCDIFDKYLVGLEQFLDHFVGRDSWIVWYTRDIGGDVVIEQGTDFRILDWERRMASGEWR